MKKVITGFILTLLVGVSGAAAEEPLVCVKVRVKPEGCETTTHETRCFRGDELVYVQQGRCYMSDPDAYWSPDYRERSQQALEQLEERR